MQVDGRPYRSLWFDKAQQCVQLIDQTLLPHRFVLVQLSDLAGACQAISRMQVRGAPLIGVTAAFGIALAMREDASYEALETACQQLHATRPTAVNLAWALEQMRQGLAEVAESNRYQQALILAQAMADDDVHTNSQIGDHGLELLQQIAQQKPQQTLNILTHCNAGWLATIDWGTALAPIYKAHKNGLDVHVWVDETRPRNQGAHLSCWELAQQGVPHTLISDNTGGHLMQQGMVDVCLVGSDRTTATGDVCNKIGTYLKALAAADNHIPFYVALPASTIDWQCQQGSDIPIEQRDAEEVTHISGRLSNGECVQVAIAPLSTPAVNYGFDVTPAHLVSGLITEHGVFQASAESLAQLHSRLFTQEDLMNELEWRQILLDTAQQLSDLGLSAARSGNVSVRYKQGMLITPSGVAYSQLSPHDLVYCDFNGQGLSGVLPRPNYQPSSEWHFHAQIYQHKPEVGAVVHTHSDYATALACQRRAIPAFHYMVAAAGGDDIPVTEYEVFGSEALSRQVVAALAERKACLLAHHGVVACGVNAQAALELAQEVESLARQYCLVLNLGEVTLLSPKQMQQVLEKFKHYGQARLSNET